MELLYQAKAQAFLSTCIAPDVCIPYQPHRAIPSKIVVPVFTTAGEVINASSVEECLSEIVEQDEEECVSMLEPERYHALHGGDAVSEADSPSEAWRLAQERDGTASLLTRSLHVEQTESKSVDWGPNIPGKAPGEWPNPMRREYRYVDIRHAPLRDGVDEQEVFDHLVKWGGQEPGLDAPSGKRSGPKSVATDESGRVPATYLGESQLEYPSWASVPRGGNAGSHAPVAPYRLTPKPLSPLDCACLGYYHFNHKVWQDGVGWILRNNFMDIIERAQKLFSVRAHSPPLLSPLDVPSPLFDTCAHLAPLVPLCPQYYYERRKGAVNQKAQKLAALRIHHSHDAALKVGPACVSVGRAASHEPCVPSRTHTEDGRRDRDAGLGAHGPVD